jgi:hypothetical protein
VGLNVQLFEGLVGSFEGFALGAKSSVAQTGTALFKGGALLTVCKTGAVFALRAVRLKLVVGALAWAAGLAAWLAAWFA